MKFVCPVIFFFFFYYLTIKNGFLRVKYGTIARIITLLESCILFKVLYNYLKETISECCKKWQRETLKKNFPHIYSEFSLPFLTYVLILTHKWPHPTFWFLETRLCIYHLFTFKTYAEKILSTSIAGFLLSSCYWLWLPTTTFERKPVLLVNMPSVPLFCNSLKNISDGKMSDLIEGPILQGRKMCFWGLFFVFLEGGLKFSIVLLLKFSNLFIY